MYTGVIIFYMPIIYLISWGSSNANVCHFFEGFPENNTALFGVVSCNDPWFDPNSTIGFLTHEKITVVSMGFGSGI